MIVLLQAFILALIWMALRGEVDIPNLLFGILVGLFLVWLGRNVTGRRRFWEPGERVPSVGTIVRKIVQIPRFLAIFLWEVIKSNIDIAWAVLRVTFGKPSHKNLQPGIIAVPLDITTDGEITMLANMITLTPGTLSLDISDDRKTVYVHAVHADNPEKTRRDIKDGFEKLVSEVIG